MKFRPQTIPIMIVAECNYYCLSALYIVCNKPGLKILINGVMLTGYYWQSEARSRLQFYFLLAVANAVVLIVWALYNKLRFQKQQHHAAYQYTPQEYAESLAIPDELYQQLQKSHRMSVHFTSQGQIKMVVSEKALVRA